MVFSCRGACAGMAIGGRGVSALRKVSRLEPAGGFEPPTFHLQGGCSTTELRRGIFVGHKCEKHLHLPNML